MKIKDFKKKIIRISILLVIVGTLIATLGFGLTGFNPDKLKEDGSGKWYRTIHSDENNKFSYGLHITQLENFIDNFED